MFTSSKLKRHLPPLTSGTLRFWSLPRRATLKSRAPPVLLAERATYWGQPSHGSPSETRTVASPSRCGSAPPAVHAPARWRPGSAACRRLSARSSRRACRRVSASAHLQPRRLSGSLTLAGDGGLLCSLPAHFSAPGLSIPGPHTLLPTGDFRVIGLVVLEGRGRGQRLFPALTLSSGYLQPLQLRGASKGRCESRLLLLCLGLTSL